MFLKNSMRALRSIRARIAFIASCAVTTGAECVLAPQTINAGKLVGNKYFHSRSQVQGSTFRVRDKDTIEDPKLSKKMLAGLPHNWQCAASFQIGNDEAMLVSASCQGEALKRRLKLSSEAGRYSHKYASKMESGDKNATLNL